VDNAFVEAFHGTFWRECLSQHWFNGLEEARRTIHTWKKDYNKTRPHSSLGQQTPVAFAGGGDFTRDSPEPSQASSTRRYVPARGGATTAKEASSPRPWMNAIAGQALADWRGVHFPPTRRSKVAAQFGSPEVQESSGDGVCDSGRCRKVRLSPFGLLTPLERYY
jgi:hypothetical protein